MEEKFRANGHPLSKKLLVSLSLWLCFYFFHLCNNLASCLVYTSPFTAAVAIGRHKWKICWYFGRCNFFRFLFLCKSLFSSFSSEFIINFLFELILSVARFIRSKNNTMKIVGASKHRPCIVIQNQRANERERERVRV